MSTSAPPHGGVLIHAASSCPFALRCSISRSASKRARVGARGAARQRDSLTPQPHTARASHASRSALQRGANRQSSHGSGVFTATPSRAAAPAVGCEATPRSPCVSRGEPGGEPSLLISSSRPATGAANGDTMIIDHVCLHRFAAFIRKALLSVRLDQRAVNRAETRGDVLGNRLSAAAVVNQPHAVPPPEGAEVAEVCDRVRSHVRNSVKCPISFGRTARSRRED